jgi:transglutaminase-like putative cysteine protease
MRCYKFKYPHEIPPKVQGLVRENLYLLYIYGFVSIFDYNIVYKAEEKNKNCFKNILELIADGYGDCEDLAAALIAMCLYKGIKARALYHVQWLTPLKSLTHVSCEIIIKNKWVEVDPSIMLGMPT